ncbi:MAG: alpha/beta hydrolase [Gammaproteobacteria bacterium]|nr:alpha/beta hydrolase [Gammaproteobacteria bacterium]
MAVNPPIIVPLVFKALSAFAPRTAGHLGFKLFCRPLSAKRVNRVQRAVQPIAEELMAAATIDTLAFPEGNGTQRHITTYTFEPSEQPAIKTTLLLHGWSSRATHLLAFVPQLTQQGHRVVAVDFPAHGLSDGRTFHLPLGVRALHAVKDRFTDWDSIIAHSLGGPVATSLVSGAIEGFDPISVRRMVLISSPNSMPRIFAQYARMIGLSGVAENMLNGYVVDLAGNPLSSFIASEQLATSRVQTLVMHDPGDQEVPFSEAADLVKAGAHVQLQEVRDVGHRRILYSSDVIERAARFCTE